MSDAMNDNDDEVPDPGEAFEALRKEVAGQGWATRKEVEALRAAVEVLQTARGVDYTPTLTALDQGQAAILDRLDAIEKHPALAISPSRLAHEISAAATRGEADQRRWFEQAAGQARIMTAVIEKAAGQVRDRQLQDRWLYGVFAGGAVVGMVLCAAVILPLLRRFGFVG